MTVVRNLIATLIVASGLAPAQETPPASAEVGKNAPSVVFIGNSLTYGDGSPVRFYRAGLVTDLNGKGIGGVPALFKLFVLQAGRDFRVSLETEPGANPDFHLEKRADILGQHWDFAVMQGQSLLDPKKPGDPALLVRSAKGLAELLHRHNPLVDIRLVATWSCADQVCTESDRKSGRWFGTPIERMALDIRAGYDLAAASGKDDPLPENSMDVDPVTDSEAIAELAYDAMIGSEFEKTHGWHVNLMPHFAKATYRNLMVDVPSVADLLAPKLKRNEPRDRAHQEYAERLGLI